MRYLLFTWDDDELPQYNPADHVIGAYVTLREACDEVREDDRDNWQILDVTTNTTVDVDPWADEYLTT